jgi:hypothetical protein
VIEESCQSILERIKAFGGWLKSFPRRSAP